MEKTSNKHNICFIQTVILLYYKIKMNFHNKFKVKCPHNCEK